MTGQPRLLADGFVFGEGPRWRGDRLWFSDMYGEAVYTVDGKGAVDPVIKLPKRRPSGLGFLPDGTVLIVSMDEREILRWDGAAIGVHADLRDLIADPCNDMVVDGRGNAYVGSHPPYRDPNGVVALVEPNGSARIVAEDMRFPNGCVISADDRTMIVVESLGRRVTRFTIAADGSLTDRSVFADCKPDSPDGICLDVDGAIWAAFPLAHEFRRIGPGGDVLDRIQIGERLAIACTLGGPDLRTLFLLTSLALPGDSIRGTRDATIHIADVDTPGSGSP